MRCVNLVCSKGSQCVGSIHTGGEAGVGEDVRNFPRSLPHDVCFKYTFISVVLKINPRKYTGEGS